MELRHLRHFKSVAEHLNFSRAAEELHLAQSALSRQIQALETEIDAKLFERNRVSVRLTDAGRTFYTRTCKILAEVDMAVLAVKEVANGSGGELIVSNDWVLGGDVVSGILARFRAEYPNIDVVLQDRKIPDQIALLRSRKVHVGFIARDALGFRGDLETHTVHRFTLRLAVPIKHRLARRGRVTIAELANETWLVFSGIQHTGYLQFFKRLCRLAGFSPIIGESAETPEGLVGRVASGFGIMLVPEDMNGIKNRHLVLLDTDCPPVELCAAWHPEEESDLLRKFVEVLRAEAKT